MARRIALIALTLLLALAAPVRAWATSPSPAQTAERLRANLLLAQLALTTDRVSAQATVAEARTVYQADLAPALAQVAAEADERVQAGFDHLEAALTATDPVAFAAARAQVWTALLAGSYQVVAQAVLTNDGGTAQRWLPLREFRQATRFSRPNADATLAIEGLLKGTLKSADVLLAVHADLLDTYQARLTEALRDVQTAEVNHFPARRAEAAALAEGYFFILAPAYAEQRGTAALAEAQQAFATLSAATLAELQSPLTELAPLQPLLQNFRAAPLSPSEQARRAGQLLRYLALVPVEYGRGVKGGQVTRELEIQEALTFHTGAQAAFTDLENLLSERDPAQTAVIADSLTTLGARLLATSQQTTIAEPQVIQTTADSLVTQLQALMPSAWQQASASGDFDVIDSLLDQMENAVRAGEYDLAESARLEAYATLETGPEARLMVFAPQLKVALENLFWNGEGGRSGLAYLILKQAPLSEVKATRAALDDELAEAQTLLSARSAPAAVATNAAVIVFREGLEAVLILASLMGSLKGAQSGLRRPLWWGAGAAFLATIATWLLARGVLLALARYGEKLEAVISLIAIGVLLLITNWFFHKTYWTGWIANFHSQKRQLLSGAAGVWLGLATLGFTSIYREGFETVLFLQALVLEGGSAVALGGVALGLGATLLIGVLTFKLQARLPHKKMLIATGVMIGVVLLVMVGNTVHVLQVVGWLPVHLIPQLALPFWTGLWFGLYPTWEGLGLQTAAAVFVVGSYYLAEYTQKRAIPVQASTPMVEVSQG